MHKFDEKEKSNFIKLLEYSNVTENKAKEILVLFDDSIVRATKMLKYLSAHLNATEDEIFAEAQRIATIEI